MVEADGWQLFALWLQGAGEKSVQLEKMQRAPGAG